MILNLAEYTAEIQNDWPKWKGFEVKICNLSEYIPKWNQFRIHHWQIEEASEYMRSSYFSERVTNFAISEISKNMEAAALACLQISAFILC